MYFRVGMLPRGGREAVFRQRDGLAPAVGLRPSSVAVFPFSNEPDLRPQDAGSWT